MALDTVSGIVSAARILVQDAVQPYRYSDDDFVLALNMAVSEAKRIRPDFFRSGIPVYSAVDSTSLDAIELTYRVPFVYYLCGQVQLRDAEETQDARAVAFIQMFFRTLSPGRQVPYYGE